MSGSPGTESGAPAGVAGESTRGGIDAMRAELLGLQEQLDAARLELSAGVAARLVEVNERLVLAALAANQAAESSAQSVRELTEAAELDPLTLLPTQAFLRTRLASAIDEAGDGHTALLLLDLTDFKLINDTLGHAAGEQVLQLAARILAAAVRPIDTVSRHGGNQFLILLPRLADVAEAVAHAAEIVGALGAPAMLNQHVLRLTASVGISIHPEDGADADSLIGSAVAAMHRAKWRGLGSYAFQGEAGAGDRSLELRTLESLRQPLVDHLAAVAESERRNTLLQEANTQLLLAAVSAQALKEAAEQAQRRQTNFLGVLAHELRNPLTPIRNAAAILGRIPTENPLLGKLQGIIETQVKSMSRLLEDLLDVTRVSSGKLRLQLESVELNQLVDGVVQACRPAMDSRLQTFKVRLATGTLYVNGDPVRLTQVMSNLLVNASKYTPPQGEINLSVEALADQVVLTVSDTGIGITSEALGTIFEPFMQEQHATVFNGAGLGIGLTVVRELVEGHGGQIAAFSAGKGAGSRFVVTLPLARAADAPA